MKFIHSLFPACVLLLFFFTRCGTTAVDRLPELDKAKADSLVKIKGHDIWVTAVSHRDSTRKRRDSHQPFQPIFCATTSTYRILAFFPITICHRPDYVFYPTELATLFAGNDSISASINRKDDSGAYKLTGSARLSFQNPLWCRQLSGPWVAEVKEITDCGGNTSTQVTLTGVPETLYWEWPGVFADGAAANGLQGYGNAWDEGGFSMPCGPGTNCGGIPPPVNPVKAVEQKK